MKSTKSKLILLGLFLLVFIVGCFVGIGTASYLYYRHVFSKQVDRSAIELGSQINLVCLLRLGELEAAITQLENMIDNNVVSVALTPNIPETDSRDFVLRGVRTYREIYPSQTQFASIVDDALADIPKIDKFESDNSLYRPETCPGRFTKSLGRLVKRAESQKNQ